MQMRDGAKFGTRNQGRLGKFYGAWEVVGGAIACDRIKWPWMIAIVIMKISSPASMNNA